jgi:predicted choloylglycine hydrolase
VRDEVIAGGPKDFMEVHHVVLEGRNEEIGRALAALAIERFRVGTLASADRLRTRVQRRYVKEHYPILHERMQGVAAAFGKPFDDDGWDFACLPYLIGPPGGCSVVHYPAKMTADGHSVVSRNYEFSTGTFSDQWPKRGELPATSRPFLIEMRPDRGYASLALCAYDLLSGVLDGINSAGLTVAVLSDYEAAPKFPIDPVVEAGVGLSELEVLRLLLDTCANVEEAKVALLLNKQYYTYLPQHYLVADRHGNAFVWEYSYAHNREYIIEDPGKPLVSTNFTLHTHSKGDRPPALERLKGVCARYTALSERIATEPQKWTVEMIKENQQGVEQKAREPLLGLIPPFRTLWHALYFPELRKLQVSFYLKDEPDPVRAGRSRIERSAYLEFELRVK